MKKKRFLLVCVLSLCAMAYAVVRLDFLVPPAQAVSCCSFATDCEEGVGGQTTPDLKCCYPGENEADCSSNMANYCRSSCRDD